MPSPAWYDTELVTVYNAIDAVHEVQPNDSAMQWWTKHRAAHRWRSGDPLTRTHVHIISAAMAKFIRMGRPDTAQRLLQFMLCFNGRDPLIFEYLATAAFYYCEPSMLDMLDMDVISMHCIDTIERTASDACSGGVKPYQQAQFSRRYVQWRALKREDERRPEEPC